MLFIDYVTELQRQYMCRWKNEEFLMNVYSILIGQGFIGRLYDRTIMVFVAV